MLLFFLLFLLCSFAICDNVIDVDDILSADFMPGNLLVLENPQQRTAEYKNSSTNYINGETQVVNSDGSVDAALTTMGYHR